MEVNLFISCFLISQIVLGQCHPLSSEFLSQKNESETSILLHSTWESVEGEKRRESIITFNNSFSSFYIYDYLNAIGSTKVNSNLRTTSFESRPKRGFFDTAQEKQRLEEEYYKSFRLFWFLGGAAIVFFICIFILTLLCFCCPSVTNKQGKVTTSIPRISATVVESDFDGSVVFDSSTHRIDIENRLRSPSVFSVNALYVPHHRLSQEQVNAIQIASQSRRGSALPSTSQGLMPSSALIDVNVIQEHRPDAMTDKIFTT